MAVVQKTTTGKGASFAHRLAGTAMSVAAVGLAASGPMVPANADPGDPAGPVVTPPSTIASTSNDSGTVDGPDTHAYVDPTLTDASRVNVSGTLRVVAGEGGEPDLLTVSTKGGRWVPVEASSDLYLEDGARIEASAALTPALADQVGAGEGELVKGPERAAVLNAAEAKDTPLALAEATITPTQALAATTTHRWFFMAMANPWGTLPSDAEILANAELTKDYWIDESDGRLQIEIQPTVTHFVSSMASPTTGCGLEPANDFGAIVDEAGKLVGATQATDHVVVVVPSGCEAGMIAGRGTLGSSLASGGDIIVHSIYAGVLIHEFGHNLGLAHASRGPCSSADSCEFEYGNYYEVMGGGSWPATALGSASRAYEDLAVDGEIPRVSYQPAVATSYAASLAPRATESGQRGVAIIDPDNGSAVYLDYRSPVERDTGAGYASQINTTSDITFGPGVTVTRAVGQRTVIETSGSMGSLGAGGSWQNGSGTLGVRVDSVGSTAQVNVDYRPGTPFSSGNLAITGQAEALRTVTADLTGTSPSPVAVTYAWTVDGVVVGTQRSLALPLEWAGKTLTLTATGYASGRQPLVITRAATVAPAALRSSSSSRPSIGGAMTEGQTLKASSVARNAVNQNGSVAVTSTLQWYRGATAIPGAVGSTYALTAADVGSRIKVSETWTAIGHATLVLSSDATGVVKANPKAASGSVTVTGSSSSSSSSSVVVSSSGKKGIWLGGKPRIMGPAEAGDWVTTTTGTWRPGTTLTYRWYVGDRRARGYRWALFVRPWMRNQWMRAEVTGQLAGYRTVTRRSPYVFVSR